MHLSNIIFPSIAIWRFFFLDMNTPELTPSNGCKPAENKSYTLSCTIFPSNPNPVTENEWFQNDKKTVNEGPVHLFDSVKKENSGSWICRGIINQNSIIIEKNSTAIQVNIFCKRFSSTKNLIPNYFLIALVRDLST